MSGLRTKAAVSLAAMSLVAAVGGCSKGAATGAASAGASTSPASAPPAAVSLTGDPCAIIDKATLAVITKPHATEITRVENGGAPTKGESRLVDGKSYIQVNGKWRTSPTTPAEMAADVAEARKTTKESCKAAGQEVIDGVPTQAFTAHVENDGSVSENKMWIARASGLPVKTISTIDGTTTVTQINRYDGITAPPL
jgi:hypothetical protein